MLFWQVLLSNKIERGNYQDKSFLIANLDAFQCIQVLLILTSFHKIADKYYCRWDLDS